MLDWSVGPELQAVLGRINDDSAILVGEAHVDRFVGLGSEDLSAFREH
jgi:hypothetical protein